MNEITLIGTTNFRNQKVRFGIKTDDRRRHMYVLGKTGGGKTTLLENLVLHDIASGSGVAFVDAHGDSTERLLDYIPKERINDVIYFNPKDLEWPIAFNPLESVDVEYRFIVASGMMQVFKKIWPDVWSPRMEYILNNTLLTLLEFPDATFLQVNRLLSDRDFRKKLASSLTDPVLKNFWEKEFAQYGDIFRAEAVAPIQNKVGQFIASPIIRNIVGQTRSAFRMREAMDSNKILIINLSKGAVGEDNAALLGAMLVTKMQLAAMSRVDIPEEERKDFYLYVDEFQTFATESFVNILSEARKYRLNIVLAHQYISQIPEKVRSAIFGNIGTIACFRIGAEDAEILVKEFAPEFDENDLVNLPKYNVYIKLLIDGLASRAFSAETLPSSPKPEISYRQEIIELSRQKYARPKAEVENEISRETKPGIESKEKFEARCWLCGNTVILNFVPKPNKPVYCRECFTKIKEAPQTESAATPGVSLKDAIAKGLTTDFKQKSK